MRPRERRERWRAGSKDAADVRAMSLRSEFDVWPRLHPT